MNKTMREGESIETSLPSTKDTMNSGSKTTAPLAEQTEMVDKFDADDNKPLASIFRLVVAGGFLASSGIALVLLTILCKAHLSKTAQSLLYLLGTFFSAPILGLFFLAYHHFLQPLYSNFTDEQQSQLQLQQRSTDQIGQQKHNTMDQQQVIAA